MSSKNSNKINVPEARAAMDKFKMEAAAEVGVNLKEGYNGDLSSRGRFLMFLCCLPRNRSTNRRRRLQSRRWDRWDPAP
uniref:small, acid-soluble spore protein, alpha/beta type n=1 Tax=Dysosmobacter welbionis TaxID=2093857 RepID=UPI003FED83A4